MTPPPPPPPPPTLGAPVAPLAPSSNTPLGVSPEKGATKAVAPTAGPDHNDQLMAAIRNGINLKPTKTNDRSTPGFIKRANGPLDANGTPEHHDDASNQDKPCSIDEMKDALQAELRNTLKRKIKQQDQGDGDGRKNEDIERAIEHTRNEVQLKLNGPSGAEGAPKVDNPLKLLVDMVDKERGLNVVVPTAAPQSSPVPSVKGNVSNGMSPATQKTEPMTNGSATLKKVSIGQGPVANGMSPPVQKTQPMPNGSATLKKVSIGQAPVTNGISPPAPQNIQPTSIGSTTLKKVSVGQSPEENGTGTKLNVSTTPWKSTSPATGKISSPMKGATPKSISDAVTTNGTGSKSPVPSRNSPTGITAAPSSSSPPVTSSVTPKINTSQTVKTTSPIGNGSNVATTNGGTAVKTATPTSSASKAPSYGGSVSSSTITKGGTYYNTLPKTFGASTRTNSASSAMASPKTAAPVSSTTPPVFSSTVKISIGGYGEGNKLSSNGASPIVRNGIPSKIEPLTIEVGSSPGSSTNGTSSPSTPKELLSPQVRSGAAAIRPSQIRTLTKAGSVVSHTDIVETPRQLAKLPISLIEPAPVLTAAAAASPPPASPRMATAQQTNSSPAKERTPMFEKAGSKEPPKSPLNRWTDSSSVSGGTARKLLLSHGRPNFTIKRSNSRQGFDVDVPDSRSDTVKPVFRILTDLEKIESEQDQREQAAGHEQQRPAGGQQQYVSFAKDLSNAPNNHPDVAVVTKTVIKPSAPSDPFLETLKDIKINIGEMKIVNAKDA
ncbi:mucin-2-like [Anopheles ziemanni]|uniref:mucin-2-like n=1 Tax=Anopheles coustani TaxID=139045 RepID=UPI00265AC1F6|nr:mucin-2-like [Anopheles coustani]XP_058170619.1 mucin-2-like [Anopheles ziemanni]